MDVDAPEQKCIWLNGRSQRKTFYTIRPEPTHAKFQRSSGRGIISNSWLNERGGRN